MVEGVRRKGPRSPAARIEKPARFEDLVSELCATFAAIGPEGLDAAIDDCLERVAEALDAERAFLARFTDDGDRLVFTNTWATEGLSPESRIFKLDLVREIPWVSGQIRRGEIIKAGPGLIGLPEAAEALREQLERDGITSGIVVPMLVGGDAVGMLGLDTVARPRDYPDPLAERLRLVADVLGSTLVRTRAEEQIRRRLHFESLLAELSQHFVATTEELEGEIERWLAPIARAIGAEHVAVGTLSVPREAGSVTVLTWNVGPEVRPLAPDEVPWLAPAVLERGETVKIGSLDELPPEAAVDRDTFASVGIRAFVSVPLVCGEVIYGGMSLCSLSRDRAWPDDLQTWLRLVGEVFANALSRRHRQVELQQALDRSRAAEASLRESLEENERLRKRLESDNLYLRDEIRTRWRAGEVVGSSPALQEVLEQAAQVATTDSTVLILGETGTGKELLARFIHQHSGRSERPLVTVNCGALPETLVEAELFGHERGAYTGALGRQIGRFETADGSTLFLDEVGDLPLDSQVKILRVLQDGEFERLGSSQTRKVDVRMIAATNRDPAQALREKRLREDLYYRLNVFPITVPPLRARPEDIPELTWSFIGEFSESMGKSVDSVPRKTMETLLRYSWPGNVRELRNVVERAMIVSAGPVLDIPLPVASAASRAADGHAYRLDEVQRRHILKVLERTRWRLRGKLGAAEVLGMKPSTLEYRMKKLGIERPR